MSADRPSPVWTPAADVYETPEAYVVRVDLPGVEAAAVEAVLDGPNLAITGERRPRDGANLVYTRSERQVGRFERVVVLPAALAAGEPTASLRDGVLEVIVAKPRGSPRRLIAIEAT